MNCSDEVRELICGCSESDQFTDNTNLHFDHNNTKDIDIFHTLFDYDLIACSAREIDKYYSK